MLYLLAGVGSEELILLIGFLLPILIGLTIVGLLIYILWKIAKKVSKN